jgi:hypothetical protein
MEVSLKANIRGGAYTDLDSSMRVKFTSVRAWTKVVGLYIHSSHKYGVCIVLNWKISSRSSSIYCESMGLRKEGVTTRVGWPPHMVECGWTTCCSQLGGVVFHSKWHYVKKGDGCTVVRVATLGLMMGLLDMCLEANK